MYHKGIIAAHMQTNASKSSTGCIKLKGKHVSKHKRFVRRYSLRHYQMVAKTVNDHVKDEFVRLGATFDKPISEGVVSYVIAEHERRHPKPLPGREELEETD